MNNTKRFVAIIGIGLAVIMPISRVFAQSFEQLSAEWWQWALSIPASVNPQTDTTGEDAIVGQHGPVWFLAGKFGGGTATRTCSVPEGTQLFFPVMNGISINVPNVCGQDKKDLTVSQVHADAATQIAGAANLSVPAGIFSPGAGDGFYVLLDPLKKGKHTLHFNAEMPAGKLNQDGTYNLTVLPVSLTE
jgi:hypothetical protein